MCVVVPLKRGSMYVTIRLPATAGPIIMAHLIGHTSRQSSRTRPKGSPSQTAELCSSGTCRRHRRCNAEFGLPTPWRVWFPHSNEASIFRCGIDTRPYDGRAYCHQLFNTANANFGASRPLPESVAQRPIAGWPGASSYWHVTNGRVACVGFARSKSCGQHGQRSDGDLGLHLLRDVPLLSRLRAVGPISRGSFVRSILLFGHPTNYPLPRQGRHFRQRQGCSLPLPGFALEPTKILSHFAAGGVTIPVRFINGLSLISGIPQRT